MIGRVVPAPTASPDGKLYFMAFDPETRVTKVRIGGFWTQGDAEEFCSRIEPFIRYSQQEFGRALFLVDRREAPVQSTEVAEILGGNSLMLTSEDRLALIVESRLTAMQFKRVLQHGQSKIFETPDEAMTWLLDGPPV